VATRLAKYIFNIIAVTEGEDLILLREMLNTGKTTNTTDENNKFKHIV